MSTNARAMTANRNHAEIPADAQSIYDGRHHLGWTLKRGKGFEAVKFDRTTIGVYDTVLQARNAVWCGGR